MPDSLRIFLAANHGEIGGGEVMLLALANAARDLGHHVTVVAPATPSGVLEAATQEGLATVAIAGTGAAAYMGNLRRWDRSERHGLLWCNGLRPALATTGRSARVVHLHQVPAGWQRRAAWLATRGAQKVVVPSETMRAEVGLGADVLENWTEPVHSSERTLPIASEPIVLGFIGRRSPDKGVDVLARALARLETDEPGRYRLLLAGEPRFVSDTDRKVVDEALTTVSELVDRPGWMDREAFYQAVDLAVVPSVWPESFGLVVAEAMSARTPFVITSAGAMPSVAGGDFPFIATPADAEDLARVIRAAVHGYTTNILEDSHQRWLSHYSPPAGRQRLAQLLTHLDAENL